MKQSDDGFPKAIRQAVRGVRAYARTGEAPLLSICGGEPLGGDTDYGRAVEDIAELMLDREILDGDEVAGIIEGHLGVRTYKPEGHQRLLRRRRIASSPTPISSPGTSV